MSRQAKDTLKAMRRHLLSLRLRVDQYEEWIVQHEKALAEGTPDKSSEEVLEWMETPTFCFSAEDRIAEAATEHSGGTEAMHRRMAVSAVRDLCVGRD